MIRFSIIIPHRGEDSLLERAIASVPVRDDIQLLVEEDSDGRGAGYARNRALGKASGEWLLFLDSDDFFSPDVLSLMDSHANDSTDVVYFSVHSVMSADGMPSHRVDNKLEFFEKYADNPGQLEYFCRYRYPEPWGKMVRRALVESENIRFDETLCANDYTFSVQLGLKARTVRFDPSPLCIITEREGSVSSSYFDSRRKLEDRLGVYWKVQQLFDAAHVREYPFYGLWTMCRKEGGKSMETARSFCRSNGITPLKLRWGYLKRVIVKRCRKCLYFCTVCPM